MATIADLVDYLAQFPPGTLVVGDDADAPDEGDYVSLAFAVREINERKYD